MLHLFVWHVRKFIDLCIFVYIFSCIATYACVDTYSHAHITSYYCKVQNNEGTKHNYAVISSSEYLQKAFKASCIENILILVHHIMEKHL